MSILKTVASLIETVVDKAIPDKGQAAELKAQLNTQLIQLGTKELESASSIIIAEAQGHSWLQRNWRPMMMVWFAGLIGAHWLGLTPDDLPEPVVLKLFDIVQLGIGGYVVGRSAEKLMKEYQRGKQ